jgi:tRNA uridine 5-carboxymethylaminomethyl modification enzyme
MMEKYQEIDQTVSRFKNHYLTIDDKILNILKKSDPDINIKGKISLDKLLKRPKIKIEDIFEVSDLRCDENLSSIVEMEIKYEGYILREMERIQKIEKMKKRKSRMI